MPISASVRDAIRETLKAAPHGARAKVMADLAKKLNVSVSTVYRAAELRATKRTRAPGRPEYREWTRTAVWVAHKKAPNGETLSLDQAIEVAIEGGALPPEAVDMPVPTAHRIARELGLKTKGRRTQRIYADFPMQGVQTDGSTSKHLVAVEQLPDGDWLLKRHHRPYPASGYKNRPLGPDRERVIYYGASDICTGYSLSRATVARGETAFAEMEFLCWAFEGAHADPRIPFHGRPDDLWYDGGNLFRSKAVADFLERLDINPNPPGRGYHKERMAVVERSHRARWKRFEAALFARDRDTIRLSELNARLLEYHVKENARRPSRTRVGGRAARRTAAWIALTNARPADNRLRKFPPNAIETIAREKERAWIDPNGIVTWNGEYEVDGWHSMHVIARRGLDGDQDHIVVEHPTTKERRVAYPVKQRAYGEIRGIPKTPLDALLETDVECGGADIFAPGRDTVDSKVAAIPARSADAAPLDDPLDAGRYPNIESAMAAFVALYPHPLSERNHALVVGRITEAGFAKTAVADIAQGLTALAQGGMR